MEITKQTFDNKEVAHMTANEELVKYIMELTPEGKEKIIDRLPRVIAQLEEQGIPSHLVYDLLTS